MTATALGLLAPSRMEMARSSRAMTVRVVAATP
jgi:hypothetical protein